MNTTDKNPNINSSGGGFYDIALEPRLVHVFRGGDCLMAEEV